jgi:Coenzyme PQQ synthesis protein D (PqqD)
MQHYTTNPQVIHETIDGETIIIDLATGTYFSLQGTAPAIWNGLTRGESDEQILTDLRSRYSGDPEEITASVVAFLAELSGNQLIAPSDSPASTHAPALPTASAERTPFAVPKLERYTDMQDIILLDPVHKVDSQGWPHPAPAATPTP